MDNRVEIVQLEKTYLNIEKFVDGLNLANYMRCNEKIPYVENQIDTFYNKIIDSKYVLVGAVDSDGDIIGGASCVCKKEGDLRLAIVRNVWVHPNYQGKGIAKLIVRFLIAYLTVRDISYIRLNVANIYMPAVNLYRKEGFLPMKIIANTPGTYFFVQMIKPLNKCSCLLRKRYITLGVSWIKFNFLFKKDSTPRGIHKILYGKK